MTHLRSLVLLAPALLFLGCPPWPENACGEDSECPAGSRCGETTGVCEGPDGGAVRPDGGRDAGDAGVLPVLDGGSLDDGGAPDGGADGGASPEDGGNDGGTDGGCTPACPANSCDDDGCGGTCVCHLGALCQGNGLCALACNSNCLVANCTTACLGCSRDSECGPGGLCDRGTTPSVCRPNPGCTDAACQALLGPSAYCEVYLDDWRNQRCALGCSTGECSGDLTVCNPCNEGQQCTSSHRCDAAAPVCSGLICDYLGGDACDAVAQNCATVGVPTAGTAAGAGAPCYTGADCPSGLCAGALPQVAHPGRCQ